MNKKGFTLAEILIAVGIVAVLAALMASAFNSAKPDKTKTLYLKGYDALTTAVSTMTNDTRLYKNNYEVNERSYIIDEVPLFDFSAPSNTAITDSPSGVLKFANLLGIILNGEDFECNESSCKFITKPGNMAWLVKPSQTTTTLADTDPDEVGYCNDIKLVINDSSFGFCVQANGDIQVLDNAGQTYINNRRSLRSANDVPATAAVTACTPDTYTVGTENADITYTELTD